MSVLPRIGQAEHRTVLHLRASGTLDVKKEKRDRIIGVEQHRRVTQTCRIDLGSRGKWNEMCAFRVSRDTHPGEFPPKQAKISGQQVTGRSINGSGISAMACAARPDLRLIITGEQRLAIRPRTYGKWYKRGFDPMP